MIAQVVDTHRIICLMGKGKAAMRISIGDKVRSAGGVEGEIVALNEDQRSVMVKIPGDWRGTGVVSIPLIRLVLIDAYTSTRELPLHCNPNRSADRTDDDNPGWMKWPH
jgi:hypothetical protein